MRTTITQNNPDSTFGEISRIVGNEVFICLKTKLFIFYFCMCEDVSEDDL